MGDLQVISIEWNHSANKTAHRTNLYDSTDLILRRGQPFTIVLNLNKPLQAGENVFFTFETGPSPSEETKTKATFPLFKAQGHEKWSGVLTANKDTSLTVTMNSPPTAAIGRYFLRVAFSSSVSNKSLPQYIGGLYFLFNPWCPDDEVFMAEEDQKQEYVLNQTGVQSIGSDDKMMVLPWQYNQFENNILDISLAILDRSLNYQKDPVLDVSQRHDPLYVCRVLNATLNSKDENGVLVGNWSGNYGDGVMPSSWTGSVNILKGWYYTGFKPVKYGQCWVFGGVLCTVLRCLGIPTRVVTNFNSAQDKNGNLFIDLYYNSHGNKNETQETIWNFHVWNEAWFKRPDLGPRYNGWQAMDATPLEMSDGVYRCGPAPVAAIKEGDVDLNYDVGFMYASVNADVAYWIVYNDGTKKRTSNNTRNIGKLISTKAVGGYDQVDITSTYKYPEGSKEEREVFEKAVNKLYESPMAHLEKNLLHFSRRVSENLLFGSITITHPSTVGQDIILILSLKNLSKNTIRVTVNLTTSSILYTGRHMHEIWTDAKSLSLGPEEEKHISIPITYAQYEKYLTEENVIRMTALCEVEGSDEPILIQRDVTLEKPPINIKFPTQAILNTAFNAEVEVSNPFSETLNSCSLLVEGHGLIDGRLTVQLPSLKPGEKCVEHFSITPFKSGLTSLLVTFTCDQIRNMKGSHTVLVVGA
ncbi:protein-glutamine gamma-glutamyltransferase E-like [Discoglossus pictus]